jgi:type I restriction enzyme S subunit
MKDLFRIIKEQTPDHWTAVPFWALYRKVKLTNFPDDELLSVYRDYGVIPKSSRDDNRNVESEDLSGYQLVEPRWLVTNKMKAWQGSIAVSQFRGIVSPAYFVYTPLHDQNDMYIHYLLRSHLYTSIYGRISKGVRIGQWDLEHEALRNVPIALPPKSEQQEIVDAIEDETKKIDQLISLSGGLKAAMTSSDGTLLSLLLEKRAALINNRVTGRIELDKRAEPKSALGGRQ